MKGSKQYLSMSEAARLTPRRPSAGTIWRWCRRGVQTRNRQYVRLRHVRVGGRVFTTQAWLEQFFEQVAAADLGNQCWQHPNCPPQMSHQRAEAMLAREGL